MQSKSKNSFLTKNGVGSKNLKYQDKTGIRERIGERFRKRKEDAR